MNQVPDIVLPLGMDYDLWVAVALIPRFARPRRLRRRSVCPDLNGLEKTRPDVDRFRTIRYRVSIKQAAVWRSESEFLTNETDHFKSARKRGVLHGDFS